MLCISNTMLGYSNLLCKIFREKVRKFDIQMRKNGQIIPDNMCYYRSVDHTIKGIK